MTKESSEDTLAHIVRCAKGQQIEEKQHPLEQTIWEPPQEGEEWTDPANGRRYRVVHSIWRAVDDECPCGECHGEVV